MLSDDEVIRLVFGLKVKYLRTRAGYSFQELSKKSGLGVSYLNEIEKAKKYPKTDKIIQLAQALDVTYDELVALKGDKRLEPAIDLLNSEFIKSFPFDKFGMNVSYIFDLFTKAPDSTAAFFGSLATIIRKYQLTEDDFNKSALRSFQDLNNNYFPHLESEADRFIAEFPFPKKGDRVKFLRDILKNTFDISFDDTTLGHDHDLNEIRSYYDEDQKILFVQPYLNHVQLQFLLLKEIAYGYLNLVERNYETRISLPSTFVKLLNGFYTSYFAAAVLMPYDQFANRLQIFFSQTSWDPESLLQLGSEYQVSAETLFQRMTNILPSKFGINDLFFLRLKSSEDLKFFSINKELHLSRLHEPYEINKEEKYCRRWVSIQILKDLRINKIKGGSLIADAQISKYHDTPNQYVCLSLARKNRTNTNLSSSVTIGFLVNGQSREFIGFLNDARLKYRIVNTTCERCSVQDCSERVSPPIELEKREQAVEIQKKLCQLGK